jgi:predicted transcriptional regulator
MLGAETSVLITTRVEPELRESLKQLAREDDRTLSSLLRHSLRTLVINHAGDGEKREDA